jgi:arabinose-5-phosphate isomerase
MDQDIEHGRDVLSLESEVISAQKSLLDERFSEAVGLILECGGQVVTTGMGKSGLIAQKISATLASTGTRSIYLHPAEAVHGDLGRLAKEDLLLALSRSGDTDELRRLIPAAKRIGVPIVAMTAEPESVLARHADCLLLTARVPEACPLRLAPTTSTTVQLALGDALAMTVSRRRNFTREEYARYHPGGPLGRALIKVRDLMRRPEEFAAVPAGRTTRETLVESGGLGRRPGALGIVGEEGRLLGLLTDGDVRRGILSDPDFLDRKVEDVMTQHPRTVRADQLAAEAWKTMRRHNFNWLPVVDDAGRYVGLLDIQDLLEGGLTESP